MPERSFKELYSDGGIYGDFTYGTPGVSRGLFNAYFIVRNGAFQMHKGAKVLVIGGGNGFEVVMFTKHGFDCKAIEFYVPDIPIVKKRTVIGSADDMPFEDNEFDLVFCTEVLEHVHEDVADAILREVKRVGNSFFFTIATKDDPPYNTHVTIKPAYYWMKKFDDMGFKILNGQMNPSIWNVYGKNYVQRTMYPDGVMIYGRCSDPEKQEDGRQVA